MISGYDHLLFVAGMVILVSTFKDVVKFATIFTVGHSLTLLAASLATWTVNAQLIDSLIAISVAYIGTEILWGDKLLIRDDGQRHVAFDAKVIVFLFGLLHGLGLATRLQALAIPEDGLVRSILGFNIGVEIGQIAALIGFLTIARALRTIKNFDRLRHHIGVALIIAGLAICAFLTGQAISLVLAGRSGRYETCREAG